MDILIIGSGGREHAIADKFHKSSKINKIYVSPGNSGMNNCATIINLKSFSEIKDFVNQNKIDFVFIGPEQPLAEGIVDFLEENNIRVIGPSRLASQIESSKVFAKDLMKKYDVPTADFQIFEKIEDAQKYLKKCHYPIVIKADGLAAGKGVVIADSLQTAENTINEIMTQKKFGESGNKIVIEEFLCGYEASIFAFCDGENFVSTIFSQDHKQIFDGDKGENTGGMGAFAPVLEAEKFHQEVDENVFKRVLDGLKAEGCAFSGVLFAGLMFTKTGVKVIEFNCRFGDPETQVVLSLLKTDMVEICQAILDKKINEINLEWESAFAVDVVAASEGYPGNYQKGKEIIINDFDYSPKNKIYFAGVREESGKLLTNGGRVLAVTTIRESLKEAIDAAYQNIQKIQFEGIYFRTDIGFKGLN